MIQVKSDVIYYEIKELDDILKAFRSPYYIEREPIAYCSKTGKPIKFENVEHYRELKDFRIGIIGCYGIYAVGKLKNYLEKNKKPIVLDDIYLIYPVESFGEGYSFHYQLTEYYKKGEKNENKN
jgi:hypothetical protein